MCVAKLPAITAEATWQAQHRLWLEMSAHTVAPATADNVSEFALHHKLADTMAVPACSCDPYSYCQRGKNGNFNGCIRRDLPKVTSFHVVTQAELNEYPPEINNRRKKVLRCLTPAEGLHKPCSKGAKNGRVALRPTIRETRARDIVLLA